MFHMCIVSFLQISVPEDGSTFMNQIYNFVGIFFLFDFSILHQKIWTENLCGTPLLMLHISIGTFLH